MRILPKLFTILILLLCKSFLIDDVHANDKSTVRLGLSAIPPMNFSPFRNTGLPYVYTWSAVFEGLTKIDANGNLKPLLAISWESIDELTWVIELRKGVKFSNGRPFDANSVVIGALSVSGPSVRIEEQKLPNFGRVNLNRFTVPPYN